MQLVNKVKEFFKEVKIEIKKVVFPSRDELMGSTWVVIVTVLVISIFLGLVDLGLSKLVGIALR
jgi:preprotein translocase subunit SecE